MSDHAARSCNGKIRYNSQRRAADAAKASQIIYGIPMNEYLCDICKRWHVGSTRVYDAKTARRERENDKIEESGVDSTSQSLIAIGERDDPS